MQHPECIAMKKGQRQMGREGEKIVLLLSSPSSLPFRIYRLQLVLVCLFWSLFPSPFEGNSYCKPASPQDGGFCCVLLLLWKQKHIYCVKHSELALAV